MLYLVFGQWTLWCFAMKNSECHILIKYFRNAPSYLMNLKDYMLWIKINIYNYLGCHYVTYNDPMKDFL